MLVITVTLYISASLITDCYDLFSNVSVNQSQPKHTDTLDFTDVGTKSNTTSEHGDELLDQYNNCTNNTSDRVENLSMFIDNISSKLVPNSINILSYDINSHQLIEPYTLHPGAPFSSFNVTKLENTTNYTNNFDNRTVAYYSDYSYHYSGVTHKPNSILSNTYLLEILDHVKRIMPNFCFNSAMVIIVEATTCLTIVIMKMISVLILILLQYHLVHLE